MRALVAGGAGFLGSHVCEALLARGHEVVCVDDFSTGAGINVRHLEGHPGFKVVESDVAEVPTLRVDLILHLASPASPVDYDRMPLRTMRANSMGTWRLLDLARERRAALVYASTSEVYGDPLVHPQHEDYWGNVDPVGPRSCYDESKRFGEALVFAARRSYRVRANVVRFFNTYGPRMRRDDGRVIPAFVGAALAGAPLPVHGDGSQTRSLCYVSDLVEGLLHVALDPELDGGILNIGNPEEVTMRELAEAIVAATGSAGGIRFLERRPGDPERRRPDIGRMTARYGWQPRVPLAEGLRRTIDWFAATAPAAADAAHAGHAPELRPLPTAVAIRPPDPDVELRMARPDRARPPRRGSVARRAS